MPLLKFTQEEILEQLPLAVCVVDSDGRVAAFNRKAAALWGREPGAGDRYGAVPCFDSHGNALDEDRNPIAVALRAGSPLRDVEVVLQRADGCAAAVLCSAEPLWSAEGRLLGAIVVWQDISDRKRAEEARRIAARLAAYARLAGSVSQKISAPLLSLSRLLERLQTEANLSVETRSYAAAAQQELSLLDQLAREMAHYCSPA